jgi:hypothetical protein
MLVANAGRATRRGLAEFPGERSGPLHLMLDCQLKSLSLY